MASERGSAPTPSARRQPAPACSQPGGGTRVERIPLKVHRKRPKDLTPEPLRLRELLEQLIEADVRFVLVGGLAVNAWGYLRATQDVDVVPDPSAENLEKLEVLLKGLGGRVDVGGRLLDSKAISTFLRTGDRTLVVTRLGRVDVLQGLPQVPAFSELDADATEIEMDGISIRVCSLDHLLAMKRASERPRDRDDLEALDAIQSGEEGRD